MTLSDAECTDDDDQRAACQLFETGTREDEGIVMDLAAMRQYQDATDQIA